MIEVTSFLARVKVNLFGGCVGTQQEDMETALQEDDETLKDMLSNKTPVPGWISNYALGSEQWE